MQQMSGTTHSLQSLAYTAPFTYIVVGETGTILQTNDGGLNWSSQSSGTSQFLSDVSFTDANIGTAVGSKWYNFKNLEWRKSCSQ